jgi:hypothetical protein
MNDEQLPPELVRLEQELARRPMPLPSAGLRQRIEAAASLRISPSASPMSMVEYVLALAAVVLLCANLSMSLANQTDYGLSRSFNTTRLDATAQEIVQLFPDATLAEARWQALPLQMGTYLTPSREMPSLNRAGGVRLHEDPDLQP